MAVSHGDRAMKAFGPELAMIEDQRIKDFVKKCFDTVCPAYFWERPASKRGFYHPKFVDGPGGLVRHVKYGVAWLNHIFRSLNGSGANDDLGDRSIVDPAIAAMIMHDMVKDGDEGRRLPPAEYKITKYHGVECMEAIWDRVMDGKIEFDAQLLILYGVAGHMGPWTEPKEFQPWNLKGSAARKMATMVHIADYCASRKVVEEMIPALVNFQG